MLRLQGLRSCGKMSTRFVNRGPGLYETQYNWVCSVIIGRKLKLLLNINEWIAHMHSKHVTTTPKLIGVYRGHTLRSNLPTPMKQIIINTQYFYQRMLCVNAVLTKCYWQRRSFHITFHIVQNCWCPRCFPTAKAQTCYQLCHMHKSLSSSRTKAIYDIVLLAK